LSGHCYRVSKTNLTAARIALRAATAQTSAAWLAVLVASGFTPTEANVFASGGMVQAIFASTTTDAEKQARDVAALLTRAGYGSVLVLDPTDEDPVWMVSGKAV
jgi:hypothetical protein